VRQKCDLPPSGMYCYGPPLIVSQIWLENSRIIGSFYCQNFGSERCGCCLFIPPA